MKYLASLLLLMSALPSSAGEAIIPFWQANAHATYTLNISNVSSTPAEVEVMFYNKDGTQYTGAYQIDNAGALNAPFTLQPNQTAWIWINGPSGTSISSSHRGYGVIKSTEAAGATGKAFIVAYGKYDGSGTHRWMGVPINNGMPF